MQNLICEMVVRADLELINPSKLLVSVGDLGARVLLYYLNLKGQLAYKRQNDHPLETGRHVRLLEGRPVTAEYLQNSDLTREWVQALEYLHKELQNDHGFTETMTHVQEREELSQRGELTVAHYLYSRAKSYHRIHTSLEGAKENMIKVENQEIQAYLLLPPSNFRAPTWMKVQTPVSGSVLTQQYLGKYNQLFDGVNEIPYPTWKAMEWLLEDFGLSRKTWR